MVLDASVKRVGHATETGRLCKVTWVKFTSVRGVRGSGQTHAEYNNEAGPLCRPHSWFLSRT